MVIAIVALLSSIILASLGASRAKSRDAAVKSDLVSLRTQAALYYANNSNAYGTRATNYGPIGCPNPGDALWGIFTLFTDSKINSILQATGKTSGVAGADATVLNCAYAANGVSYAVYAPLSTSPVTWWCVDSTGASRNIGTDVGIGIYICPP